MLCLSFVANSQLGSLGVGDTAPAFTVTDIHGQTHTLSDYAGKWVMVDLFTYWCGPCQAVAPTLNEFYKKYGCNAYEMIVLSIEGDGTEQQTIDFENNYGGDANFPTPSASGQGGGGGAVHTAYDPVAYPTIILIGPDGLIKNQDIWPISGVSTFENAVSAAGGSSILIPNECSAGMDEFELGSISLFPNPSNGDFTVTLSTTVTESVQLELISLVGSLVHSDLHDTSLNGSSIQVSTEALEKGSYLVRLTGIDSGKTVTRSITIN